MGIAKIWITVLAFSGGNKALRALSTFADILQKSIWTYSLKELTKYLIGGCHLIDLYINNLPWVHASVVPHYSILLLFQQHVLGELCFIMKLFSFQ